MIGCSLIQILLDTSTTATNEWTHITCLTKCSCVLPNFTSGSSFLGCEKLLILIKPLQLGSRQAQLAQAVY
jgi:hypothetical protein